MRDELGRDIAFEQTESPSVGIVKPVHSVPPRLLVFVRLALASLWAFEGLWLKVVARDPHELRIVESAARPLGLPGLPTMVAIGLTETVLAAAIASGLWARQIAWIQLAVLILMNLLGIVMGGGEIRDPVGLLVHNLPTFACIALLIVCGAGSWRSQTDA